MVTPPQRNGTYPVDCPTEIFKYQTRHFSQCWLYSSHISEKHTGRVEKNCLPRGSSKHCSKKVQQEAIMKLSKKKVIYPEEEDGSGRYIHETVMSGKNKPVKIRSYNSSKKYGVAAKHVKELLDKGCKLLKVRPVSNRFRRPFNRAVVKVVSRIPNNQKLKKKKETQTQHLYVLQFLLCLLLWLYGTLTRI